MLAHQWRRAPDLYAALGWAIADTDELEADDLLGAHAHAEEAAGGQALILTGDLEAARIELVTALELESSPRTARNLVLVHLLEDQRESAQRVAQRHGIDEAGFERLQRRADRLRARKEMGG